MCVCFFFHNIINSALFSFNGEEKLFSRLLALLFIIEPSGMCLLSFIAPNFISLFHCFIFLIVICIYPCLYLSEFHIMSFIIAANIFYCRMVDERVVC